MNGDAPKPPGGGGQRFYRKVGLVELGGEQREPGPIFQSHGAGDRGGHGVGNVGAELGLVFDEGEGQGHVAGLLQPLGELGVGVGLAPGEDNVEHDGAGAGGVEVLHQVRPQQARPGPAPDGLAEGGEAGVVDVNDDDFRGRRLPRWGQLDPQVEAAILEELEPARPEHGFAGQENPQPDSGNQPSCTS